MRTPTARKAGRPARLSREKVLAAALALADDEGIESLTMHNVGRKLGAEAMSLYRHVRNKDEILDGLVDLVFEEIAPPQPASDWKASMRERAFAVRDALVRHPWAVGLMESRSHPGPANLRHHDAVLAVLLGAGFTSLMATHAYNSLDSYIFGFVLQENSIPIVSTEPLTEVGGALLDQVARDAYPHLKQVGLELIAAGFVYADEFAYGLDLILDGIERARAESEFNLSEDGDPSD